MKLTIASSASPLGVTHASELAYVSRVSTAPIAKVMNDYYTSCKLTHAVAPSYD